MKVLITGTSQGIGKAIAERFLQSGHTVVGIDRQAQVIENVLYTHYECDVRDKELQTARLLPNIISPLCPKLPIPSAAAIRQVPYY